jgi:citrate synthase
MEAISDVRGRAGETINSEALAKAATELVTERRAEGRRIPGFGHRQHKRRDPRLDRLLEVAEEVGVTGDHIAAAVAIELSLAEALGRPAPMNIDGAMAAILGEIGFPNALGNAVFIASRVAGILAHAEEERRTMPPMRRIDPVDHQYGGVQP